MPTIQEVRRALKAKSSPARAKVSRSFFRTGPGEYGEGDVFIGLTVPDTRIIAKQFADLPFSEVKKLLQSKIHEERLTALLMLVHLYEVGGASAREKIVRFYLSHLKWVNNWDLVDLSADKILGTHLLDKPHTILRTFAKSKNIWIRRVAMVATYAFIKRGQFDDALAIAGLLVADEHDLIHKAVGWMLREVGKRNLAAEEKFLKKHYRKMPRTMLRYAIERFPERRRQEYLH